MASIIDVSQLLSITSNHCSINICLLYGLDVHVVHEELIPLFHHFTDLVKNIVLHANRCAIEHKHFFCVREYISFGQFVIV